MIPERGGERLREAFPCESRGNGLLGHVGLEDGILGFEMGEKREDEDVKSLFRGVG
jgi:hypothetical protein